MTDTNDDPPGVFTASDAATEAAARKLLRRANVFEPSAEQLEDARESARIEYAAQAQHAIRTGKVLS
jgi:hypothetical protein